MQYWWLIAISISSGVAGQTAIKLGVNQIGAISSTPLALITAIYRTPLILLGLILYGVGALSWIAVLSRLNLSYAYPFLALNFVLVALVSRIALGETIPPSRWLGIAIICLGIILAARSPN